MDKALRSLLPALLVLAAGYQAHANAPQTDPKQQKQQTLSRQNWFHQNIAPLGQDIATQIVGQSESRTQLLDLVQAIKNELKATEVLLKQLSDQAEKETHFFARFFENRRIEAAIEGKIAQFDLYQQQLATTLSSFENKDRFIAKIEDLTNQLHLVIEAKSDAKAVSLRATHTAFVQAQQVDGRLDHFRRPAAPYSFKQQTASDTSLSMSA